MQLFYSRLIGNPKKNVVPFFAMPSINMASRLRVCKFINTIHIKLLLAQLIIDMFLLCRYERWTLILYIILELQQDCCSCI